jgi:hypothetical protein
MGKQGKKHPKNKRSFLKTFGYSITSLNAYFFLKSTTTKFVLAVGCWLMVVGFHG